jgi:hypothetical protein
MSISSLVVLLIAECRDPTVTSVLAHPVCSVAILDGPRLSSRIVGDADQWSSSPDLPIY